MVLWRTVTGRGDRAVTADLDAWQSIGGEHDGRRQLFVVAAWQANGVTVVTRRR